MKLFYRQGSVELLRVKFGPRNSLSPRIIDYRAVVLFRWNSHLAGSIVCHEEKLRKKEKNLSAVIDFHSMRCSRQSSWATQNAWGGQVEATWTRLCGSMNFLPVKKKLTMNELAHSREWRERSTTFDFGCMIIYLWKWISLYFILRIRMSTTDDDVH